MNSLWTKRLPTVLSAFFVIFSLATIGWLSRNAVLFGTKAASGETPKDVQVSNITDTSFTVSYHTDDRVAGSVNYGSTKSFGKTGLDERNQTTSSTYRIHSITIAQLIPSTKYYFSITSGHTLFNNNTLPYEVTTAPAGATNTVKGQTISGDVSLDDGSIPTEALIYISSNNSQLISSLTRPDGSYTITLNNLHTKDLTTPLSITNNELLHMTVVTSSGQSNVTLLAGKGNPVPLITIPNDYDFSTGNLPISSSPVQNVTGFPVSASSQGAGPAILSPKTQEKLQDQQPVFSGKALPNSTVQITIHSTPTITATVKADSSGNWTYRPTAPLAPGVHTVSITTLDISGILKTLTQPFSVLVKGSQFSEPSVSPVASTPTPTKSVPIVTTKPTATPTVKLLPTATPTRKPTVTPTAKPTLIAQVITSTPIPTARPTLTPTTKPTLAPTRTPTPTVSVSSLGKPGSSSLLIGLMTTIAIVGVGIILFVLTRGSKTI